MSHWRIELHAAGKGVVQHRAFPRFTARWSSGEADWSAIDGLFWQDEAGGEDDLILYDFRWQDASPDQAAFEALMRQAARAIDDWIADRF